MQRVPSSCSGTALARLIPEPPSLLGPNLCTSYYADNSPSTKAHNLSRIIEEHDGTLSHFNNGRATHRSHAPHAPISSRSNQTRMTRVGSNLSEASEVIKPTAPPMNINSDKVTMEMVNQFEINRRLHQSRALPKTFTSTRHRRAHIARQGRRNPLKKVQRLPIIHNAVSNHLKPWKVSLTALSCAAAECVTGGQWGLQGVCTSCIRSAGAGRLPATDLYISRQTRRQTSTC